MCNHCRTASLACLWVLVLPWLVAAQEARPEKWEYSELRHYDLVVDMVGPDAKKQILWISAEGLVRGFGWEAMAEQLKMPALKKDALKDVKKYDVDAIQRLRILNHLGGQGWEIISYARNEKDGSTLWLFKRRVGK